MDKLDLQILTLKVLKDNIAKIQKECDRVSETIAKEGALGNYSINSEILELAMSIYRDCSMLGYLKNFDLQLGEENERS